MNIQNMNIQEAKQIVGTVDYFEMLNVNKTCKAMQNSILGETKEDTKMRIATTLLLKTYTPSQWGIRIAR